MGRLGWEELREELSEQLREELREEWMCVAWVVGLGLVGLGWLGWVGWSITRMNCWWRITTKA